MADRTLPLLERQAIIEALPSVEGSRILVCDSMGYAKGMRRKIIVTLGPNGFRVLADGWVERTAHVLEWIDWPSTMRVRAGCCDAYFATKPWRCWTTGGDTFSLWTRRRQVLEVDRASVTLSRRTIAVDDVIRVEAFAASGWTRLGVRLCLTDGNELTISGKANIGRTIDPTYDGIDLRGDMAWAEELATALADYIGVPTESVT